MKKQRILEIDETRDMMFVDPNAEKMWNEAVETAGEFKLQALTFARRWAKYMQYLMEEEHQRLGDILPKLDIIAEECDVDGITFQQYKIALGALKECWRYGYAL